MDGSAYLAAILHAFGICFAERSSLRDALDAADPHRDLLLLPHGSETVGVESFLQAGEALWSPSGPPSHSKNWRAFPA